MPANPDRRLLIFLALPFIAFAIMIGMNAGPLAESEVAEYTFPIAGYDPRDLLHGHYLEVNIDHEVSGKVEDSAPKDCMCIANASDNVKHLKARNVGCESMPEICPVMIYAHWNDEGYSLSRHYRVFIPETRADELQKILRDQPERLRLHVRVQDKELKVLGLRLDGKDVN